MSTLKKLAFSVSAVALLGAADAPPSEPIIFMDFPAAMDPDHSLEFYDPSALHLVKVISDDQILWDGQAVNKNELLAKIKAEIVGDDVAELALEIGDKASYETAYSIIVEILAAKVTRFGFAGNEKYGEFEVSAHPSAGPVTVDKSKFGTKKNLVAVQVFSTDQNGFEPGSPAFSGSSIAGKCRVFYDNKPVNSEALAKASSDTMEATIESHGGFEKIKRGVFNAEWLPKFVVVAPTGTPARCVGGVIHNLHKAGHLQAGFAQPF